MKLGKVLYINWTIKKRHKYQKIAVQGIHKDVKQIVSQR